MKESTYTRWYKKWWGILIIFFSVLILAFIFASALYVYGVIKSGEANKYQLEETNLSQDNLELILGNANNYYLGAKNPLITIIEFSDFACPYSRESFSVIRELGIKYKNNIKIIYRDFPVITDYSANLSLAARCAGEQGLFWVMHDKLFINQGVDNTGELLELARQIGADTDRFNDCVINKKYLSAIEKDFNDGQELNIKGTPTWFINGTKLEGNVPYNIFVEIIEDIINK
ncbi:hypothetical protein DRH27_04580 [Candidatus Falkowbacteria bacterium]|nr:MAG: hypothetical protein DRH27_04580 [Candidatus Falkowbacteria bacterium]